LTIKPEIRDRIIQLSKEGSGRNEIAKTLRISQGSVTNIISAWKSSQCLSQSSDSGKIKNDHDKIAGAAEIKTEASETTQSHKIELTPLEHVESNNDSDQEINIQSDNSYPPGNSQKGGPLSWFAPLMTNGTSAVESEISAVNNIYGRAINTPLELGLNSPNKIEEFEPDVDFADTPYQDQSEISCTNNKTVNQHIQDDEEDEEIDFSDSSANLDIEEEGFLLDSDPAVVWPRLLKQIKHEKNQRRHEILVLERKKKILDIREDQINHDLEQLEHTGLEISARETRIYEAEPLLSLARQFQSMGLDFDSLLPWIETLREQAAGGIDFKTAATYMIHEIKSYRELGGLQKQLEIAREQLQMLKMTTVQKERGLNMLAELENKGVSLDVIYELSKVLDLEKIAKELSVRTNPWSNIIPNMGLGSVPNTNNISVSTQGVNNPVNNGNDDNWLGQNGNAKKRWTK